MFYSPAYDMAGPGLLLFVLAIGAVYFIVAMVIIVLIEAATLTILRWGSFGRSFLAALSANFITTLLGFGLMAFVAKFTLWGLLVAYILSIILEAFVLMPFKRGATRNNWIASAVMNTASYLLVLFPVYVYSIKNNFINP